MATFERLASERKSIVKGLVYETITGRTLDLRDLSGRERTFLAAVREKYREKPEWSRFSAWWTDRFNDSEWEDDSPVFRICQDLEARLGIAQGKVAAPDYRDYLADLIEERYGSRYRFCKETGVDPGHLSRVLASRSELSLRTLQSLVQNLGAALIIQRQDTVAQTSSPDRAIERLATVASS